MKNILERIVSNTLEEVGQRKKKMPINSLREQYESLPPVSSLRSSLQKGSGVIAEFKRKSPSKGIINDQVTIKEVVSSYRSAGASAVSVLTDLRFFGGSLIDLQKAREVIDLPILQKDFMVDAYQLYEARAYGADAVLLIAAVLDDGELEMMAREAIFLGLEILFEVHDKNELFRVAMLAKKLDPTKICIGVNNRNLKAFKTDTTTSLDLFDGIPEGITAVSESGISDPEVVKKLKALGYQGFLIGECFMKESNPGKSCLKFIQQI